MSTHNHTPIRDTDRIGRRRRVSGGGTDFLSDREICARRGYSLTTLWRLRKAGKFPPAVQISPGRRATPIAVYNAHVAAESGATYGNPEAA